MLVTAKIDVNFTNYTFFCTKDSKFFLEIFLCRIVIFKTILKNKNSLTKKGSYFNFLLANIRFYVCFQSYELLNETFQKLSLNCSCKCLMNY